MATQTKGALPRSHGWGRHQRPYMPAAPTKSDQRVDVEFEDHDEQPLVSVVPDQTGCMSVRPLTGNPRRLTQLVALKLLGFVGG